MKSKITILATLITCFSLFSFSAIAADTNVKDRVGEIKLRMQCGGTRSGSATAVTAYINNDIITVETANYAGDSVLIEIFDADGILQVSSHFDYTDYCVVDISSLPPGKYEIVVTLDYGYRGSFER